MKELDLNLLPLLQTLLEVRNVSRAAERVFLSQPSMSQALAKLRRHFDDELLVRAGRDYELTPFAEHLMPQVNSTLAVIEETLHLNTQFDPATSDRTFVVAASDYVTSVLMKPLRKLLITQAPDLSIHFVPSTTIRAANDDYAGVDLLIGPMGQGFDFRGTSRQLFRDDFVIVMDSTNPLLSLTSLTLKDILLAPYAAADFGPGVETPPAQFFREKGVTPSVVARVSDWQSMPLLVSGTDLIALMPRRLAYRVQTEPPTQIVEFSEDLELPVVEGMFWSPRRTIDPAHAWLRGLVQQACEGLDLSTQHRVHEHQVSD